jgi:hypothetical protein
MNDTRRVTEKNHWACKNCGKDTFLNDKDYYMVRHDIWAKIGVGTDMLCMGCMENRLGHTLRKYEILRCLVTEQENPYTKKILNS